MSVEMPSIEEQKQPMPRSYSGVEWKSNVLQAAMVVGPEKAIRAAEYVAVQNESKKACDPRQQVAVCSYPYPASQVAEEGSGRHLQHAHNVAVFARQQAEENPRQRGGRTGRWQEPQVVEPAGL
jgi:hypothetical protein